MFNKWVFMATLVATLAGFALLLSSCVRPMPPPERHEPRPGVRTRTFTLNGSPLRVHAIPTGFVGIKHCHHTGCLPENTPYLARFASILASRGFADPLPIWTYAIEHPEGVFLVDAGGDASYYDDESWSESDPKGLIQSFIRLDVQPGESLPERLTHMGIPLDLVQGVVLTHQHVDHTASVPSFPNALVWTTRAEHAAADQIGALHQRWAKDATFRFVDDSSEREALGVVSHLTTDQALTALHTGGHTPGSVTIRLRTDQGDVWFIGDIAFDLPGLAPKAPTAGIHTHMRDVRALQRTFHNLADTALILPAHDVTVPQRLTDWTAPNGER